MLERIFGGLDFLAQGYVVAQAVQANQENGVEYSTMIDEGRFDVNLRGPWPNDAGCDTTLLLSAIEYRNIHLIEELLARGADVTARDDQDMGVIDLLLWGHGYYDVDRLGSMMFTIPIWALLEPHSPPRTIKAVTLSEFQKSWKYKNYPESFKVLIDLVASCTTVD